MILLDTNIISEMMKPAPAKKVISWLDAQDSMQLFICSITIAEINYGIHVLPKGNRCQGIEMAFNKTIAAGFKHRIMHFDETAANSYGMVMAQSQKSGRTLSVLDGQIAAIAVANGAALATRNIRDFEHCPLVLFYFLDW